MQVVGYIWIRKARNKYFFKFDCDDNECRFYVTCNRCVYDKKKKRKVNFQRNAFETVMQIID